MDSITKSELSKLLGKENQISIATSKYLVNSILFPIVGINDIKNTKYIQYNADDKYNCLGCKDFTSLNEKWKLFIMVHNIQNNTKLKFTESSSPSPDQSIAASEIESALTGFSGVISTLSPLSGNIGRLMGLFNANKSFLNNQVIPSPSGDPRVGSTMTEVNNQERYSFILRDNLNSISDPLYSMQESFETFPVYINGRKVTLLYLLNEDKKRIITASLYKNGSSDCKTNCDTFSHSMIAQFINIDSCYDLNYVEKVALQKDVTNLVCRFKNYVNSIKKCQEDLKNLNSQLSDKTQEIYYLLRIYNRSLPGVGPKERSEEIPEKRTFIKESNLPGAGNKYLYSLQEPRPEFPGSTVTIDSIIDKQSYKVGKNHFISFSAGLAYTTRAYDLTQQSGNSLPETTPGDQFRFIAGIHYYPWGLFKLDNRFFTKEPLKRLSVFAALSIPETLNNYYLGLGYDIVPGIILTIGGHFYLNSRYTIQNNQVIEKASGLSTAGLYVSFNIEPTALVKALGIFQK